MMNKKSKILYFDIETSLMEVYTHYIGSKVSIHPHQIKKLQDIICICYSWGNSNKVEELVWRNKGINVAEKFNEVAKKADIIVGHNGINFDVKHIRTQLALTSSVPWCETKVVDTLSDYRRMFRFPSNKLDFIAKITGGKGKDKMEFEDWVKVQNGDKKALKKMVKYCKQDVKELKRIHKYLDPYVKETLDTLRYKNLAKGEINECLVCKSNNLIKYGRYVYKGQDLQRYLCKDCFKVNKI